MPLKNHHYNSNLKDLASDLRNNSVSKAEMLIWKAALSRKQLGFGFKRQRPIRNYIVDFFCKELDLIIEIDGNSHHSKGKEDHLRQSELESLGYTVVRFEEGIVLNQFERVYEDLVHIIDSLKEQKGY
ncbi:MAG: DUF559 domain-containing protein [Flavobacteriales bacterium]|nr:DUF559 domain-containing protein [Flavobacteriales bacterium]